MIKSKLTDKQIKLGIIPTKERWARFDKERELSLKKKTKRSDKTSGEVKKSRARSIFNARAKLELEREEAERKEKKKAEKELAIKKKIDSIRRIRRRERIRLKVLSVKMEKMRRRTMRRMFKRICIWKKIYMGSSLKKVNIAHRLSIKQKTAKLTASLYKNLKLTKKEVDRNRWKFIKQSITKDIVKKADRIREAKIRKILMVVRAIKTRAIELASKKAKDFKQNEFKDFFNKFNTRWLRSKAPINFIKKTKNIIKKVKKSKPITTNTTVVDTPQINFGYKQHELHAVSIRAILKGHGVIALDYRSAGLKNYDECFDIKYVNGCSDYKKSGTMTYAILNWLNHTLNFGKLEDNQPTGYENDTLSELLGTEVCYKKDLILKNKNMESWLLANTIKLTILKERNQSILKSKGKLPLTVKKKLYVKENADEYTHVRRWDYPIHKNIKKCAKRSWNFNKISLISKKPNECPLTELRKIKKIKLNLLEAISQVPKFFKKNKFKIDTFRIAAEGTEDLQIKKYLNNNNSIYYKIWELKTIASMDSLKIIKTNTTGKSTKSNPVITQLSCGGSGCTYMCKSIVTCRKILNELPQNIIKTNAINIQQKNRPKYIYIYKKLEEGFTIKQAAEQERRWSLIRGEYEPKLRKRRRYSIAYKQPLKMHKLKECNGNLSQYAKAIRTNGNGRSYHKKTTLIMSQPDYTIFYKKKDEIDLRVLYSENQTKFYLTQTYLRNMREPNIVNLFTTYIKQTRPVLAYYLVRKRSYLKKRKVFINSFKLKIAKDFNRNGKLFHQIKTIFFRSRNRKTAGSIEESTKKFISSELFKTGNSSLLKKKIHIYKRHGHDSMNELLFKLL